MPYKAGGGTDAYARAISAAAKDVLDVPVVVVNGPGSGGLNGANSVVGARARRLHHDSDVGRFLPAVDHDAGHRYRSADLLRFRRLGR